MKLDVSRAIREAGRSFPLDVVQTIAPQDILGETVTLDDAHLVGSYMADDQGTITVEGDLSTIAHARCANCLEPATTPIETHFSERFVRDGDEKDDETFAYGGSVIDFEKLAMANAVLALPLRFLCREDCPGLMRYASSGTDEDASQKELQNEHPFAALQNLLTKDEEV